MPGLELATYLSPLYLEYHYFIRKKERTMSRLELTTSGNHKFWVRRLNHSAKLLRYYCVVNFSYIRCFARFTGLPAIFLFLRPKCQNIKHFSWKIRVCQKMPVRFCLILNSFVKTWWFLSILTVLIGPPGIWTFYSTFHSVFSM